MHKKIRYPFFLTVLTFSLLVTTACASQTGQVAPASTSTDSVFLNPSNQLGAHMSIRGYLRWTVENKNLFPVWMAAKPLSEKYCLPMLIKGDKKELIETVSHLDDEIVTVTGVIVAAAPPGMVSIPSCKQIGIDVSSITKG